MEFERFVPNEYVTACETRSWAESCMNHCQAPYEYIFLDESENENNVFYVDLRNARVYDGIKSISEYTMRIVMTVKGDLLIKSGKGTLSSPYYIR